MAKWIYEKWSIKWDYDAIRTKLGASTSTELTKKTNYVDIGTLEVVLDTESYAGGVSLNTPADINSFNDGLTGNASYFENIGSQIYSRGVAFYTSRDWLQGVRLKDERLPDVTLEEGTVPDDGIHTDGYWYVKVKKAFPMMRILRDGQWAEVETGFVLKDGVWKPIEEIYKLQDGQWVQA